ncbi:MAG: MFS transporter [Gemmataceae bacterium]
MHLGDEPTSPSDPKLGDSAPFPKGPWWRALNRYHWFVFCIAALGWLFDTMDQQLFVLNREPAMKDLVPVERVKELGSYATSIFLLGWATGGLIFGVVGDRFGRAKTMMMTILLYSIFTGLSALTQNFWQFALARFLTGLGVGGEFAVGVALLAEVMPEQARASALGWLQSLSSIGNVTAAVLTMFIQNWRGLFLVGTLPALMVLFVMRRLKEPERWQSVAVSHEVKRQLGSYRELFGDPRWRHNALVGLALGFAGIVGLWGIGFFSFELLRDVFEPVFKQQGLDDEAIRDRLVTWVGVQSIVQNLGGFFGIQCFMHVAQRMSRKFAFLVSFLSAIVSTAFTYWFFGKVAGIYDVFWMIPIMGACQLSLFGGYAIYFPELFPTWLRSTGTSFCYNVGRFIAAIGPFTLGGLVKYVFAGYPEPMRYGGVSMCVFFLVGLAALPFAPETKGQPLPE